MFSIALWLLLPVVAGVVTWLVLWRRETDQVSRSARAQQRKLSQLRAALDSERG